MNQHNPLSRPFFADDAHLIRMRIVAFVIGFTAATCLMIAASHAQTEAGPPLLKEQIKVNGDIITLGDLFENAGDAAGTPVFRSPNLGQEGIVRAARIKRAAQRYGLDWPNPGGVQTVTILRPSRLISADEQESLIREALADRAGIPHPSTLDITFTPAAEPLHLDPKIKAPIVVKSINHSLETGSFKVVIGPSAAQADTPDRTLRGRAFKTVKLYVPRRLIDKGKAITEDDLKTARVPTPRLQDELARTLEKIVGMAPKRTLRANQPIRLADLEEPKLVNQNAIVDIVFDSNGLSLKSEGRSLQDGTLGDAVKVVNTHSKRTLIATVIGPGVVSVSPRKGTPQPRPQPQRQAQTTGKKTTAHSWEPVYRVR